MLDQIATLPHHYSRGVIVVAIGIGVCGVLPAVRRRLGGAGDHRRGRRDSRLGADGLNQRQVNYFLVVLLTALTASLVAGSALWLSQTPQSALTAAVLLLVPGVPLINASVDILRGHISAGLARATTSLVVFLGIALGLGIVVRLLQVQL